MQTAIMDYDNSPYRFHSFTNITHSYNDSKTRKIGIELIPFKYNNEPETSVLEYNELRKCICGTVINKYFTKKNDEIVCPICSRTLKIGSNKLSYSTELNDDVYDISLKYNDRNRFSESDFYVISLSVIKHNSHDLEKVFSEIYQAGKFHNRFVGLAIYHGNYTFYCPSRKSNFVTFPQEISLHSFCSIFSQYKDFLEDFRSVKHLVVDEEYVECNASHDERLTFFTSLSTIFGSRIHFFLSDIDHDKINGSNNFSENFLELTTNSGQINLIVHGTRFNAETSNLIIAASISGGVYKCIKEKLNFEILRKCLIYVSNETYNYATITVVTPDSTSLVDYAGAGLYEHKKVSLAKVSYNESFCFLFNFTKPENRFIQFVVRYTTSYSFTKLRVINFCLPSEYIISPLVIYRVISSFVAHNLLYRTREEAENSKKHLEHYFSKVVDRSYMNENFRDKLSVNTSFVYEDPVFSYEKALLLRRYNY